MCDFTRYKNVTMFIICLAKCRCYYVDITNYWEGYLRASGNSKKTKKKQHGSRLNYFKIFIILYVSTILSRIFGTK